MDDGSQSRDFTYIDNVVQANMLACHHPRAAGHVYNIACGQRYTLLELTQHLNRIIETTIVPSFDRARPGDVFHSLASIDKAQNHLGYEPSVHFEQGLRAVCASLRPGE